MSSLHKKRKILRGVFISKHLASDSSLKVITHENMFVRSLSRVAIDGNQLFPLKLSRKFSGIKPACQRDLD